jgi:hypothetical protein
VLFLAVGAFSLFGSAMGIIDYTSRLAADVLKTTYAPGASEHRMYFWLVWGMVGLGCVILLAGVSQPLTLLVISASTGGTIMFLYSFMLIALNRRMLPPALRIGRSGPPRSCGPRCSSDRSPRSRSTPRCKACFADGRDAMKALLLSEYKKLSVVDMPVPDVGDGDVLVRVRACGICGSDIHGYDGSTGRRIPPLVMGHEAAGVIERVGAGVRGFERATGCRSTRRCRAAPASSAGAGGSTLCDNRTVLGVLDRRVRRHGAFAEYVAVPSRILYKLPDSLPFERAALLEAVSVAVHAVEPPCPGAG